MLLQGPHRRIGTVLSTWPSLLETQMVSRTRGQSVLATFYFSSKLSSCRVSSAVVQRYITPILEAALSQNPQIQAVAVDILSFTVKQGLAHPLQSFPVIVALETSPVTTTSARANALHAVLYSKHMTLLNSRFIVSAKQSFKYQKSISPNNVQGW